MTGNLLEFAGESKHFNLPSSKSTSPVICRCDAGSACEEKTNAHQNISSELQTSSVTPTVGASPAPQILKLGGSTRISMITGERDTTRNSFCPVIRQSGSMTISMMSGESDITLVSSHPVTAEIRSTFSCAYNVNISTDNQSDVHMPSTSSDQHPAIQRDASMQHELLTGVGEGGNPAEISFCDDASSVADSTVYAADVKSRQQVLPDKTVPGDGGIA